MAKIDNFKKLIKEDFDSKYQDLVDKLGYSINPFAEEMVNILSNGLSIDDNLNWAKAQINVQVDSTGAPITPTKFKSGISGNSYGIGVEKVVPVDSKGNIMNSAIYPTNAPFISYSESNGIITINNITGLPAGQKFQLNLTIKS